MLKSTLFVRKYPFSLLCVALVWVLSLTPFFPETPLDEVAFIDKWTHFVMYGIFTISLLSESKRGKRTIILLLIPIFQGLLVELAQAYLTTCRSGDWFDALCNTLGVLVGAVLFLLFSKMKMFS
jgi:VanZ family protein